MTDTDRDVERSKRPVMAVGSLLELALAAVLRLAGLTWLPLILLVVALVGFGGYVAVVSIKDSIKYRKEPKIQRLNLK